MINQNIKVLLFFFLFFKIKNKKSELIQPIRYTQDLIMEFESNKTLNTRSHKKNYKRKKNEYIFIYLLFLPRH